MCHFKSDSQTNSSSVQNHHVWKSLWSSSLGELVLVIRLCVREKKKEENQQTFSPNMKYCLLVMVIGASFVALVLGDENAIPKTATNDDSGNFLTNAVSLENVFDWVFGDPDDEQFKHEVDEHFGYLTSGHDDRSLADLAQLIGIKPDFLNFKAHDYDNNDKIDGLEMLALIVNERSADFGHAHGQHQNHQQFPRQPNLHLPHQQGQNPQINSQQAQQNAPNHHQNQANPQFQNPNAGQNQQNNPLSLEQYLQLSSKVIDRLFGEEDSNNDGFLDFGEYSSARSKLGAKNV